jgi:hypothetical protein
VRLQHGHVRLQWRASRLEGELVVHILELHVSIRIHAGIFSVHRVVDIHRHVAVILAAPVEDGGLRVVEDRPSTRLVTNRLLWVAGDSEIDSFIVLLVLYRSNFNSHAVRRRCSGPTMPSQISSRVPAIGPQDGLACAAVVVVVVAGKSLSKMLDCRPRLVIAPHRRFAH